MDRKNSTVFSMNAATRPFSKKGKVSALGHEGVSLAFGMRMVKVKASVSQMREEIRALEKQIETDDFFNVVPSVKKRIDKGGFFFHAKDDVPEIRERLFRWIRGADLSFEMVMARKIPGIFASKHNGQENEFYADLLSHLLKNKLSPPTP